MFRAVHFGEERPSETVPIEVNGKQINVTRELTVAAALLTTGVHTFRHTPVSGQPRGPLCMMGVCFECLVVIDGVPNQQSCMRQVEPGMRVCLQEGARDLKGTS